MTQFSADCGVPENHASRAAWPKKPIEVFSAACHENGQDIR
jgi:hypothetical protein